MFIDITSDCAIAKVTLSHPEDSSETKYLVIGLYNYEEGDYYTNDQLKALINDNLNRYHYWHDVEITLIYPFALDSIEEGTYCYNLD